jgi:hypothetical protein
MVELAVDVALVTFAFVTETRVTVRPPRRHLTTTSFDDGLQTSGSQIGYGSSPPRKPTMPTPKRSPEEPDWKLVLADIRRTERDVAEAQELIGAFRETLDVVRKRLIFIRSCVEKRARRRA